MSSQTTGQPINPGVFLRMQASVRLMTEVITKHSYCIKHCTSSASPLIVFQLSGEHLHAQPQREQVETSLLHPPLGPCFLPASPRAWEELPTNTSRPASSSSWKCSLKAVPQTAVRPPRSDKATPHLVGLGDLFRAHAHSLPAFSLLHEPPVGGTVFLWTKWGYGAWLELLRALIQHRGNFQHHQQTCLQKSVMKLQDWLSRPRKVTLENLDSWPVCEASLCLYSIWSRLLLGKKPREDLELYPLTSDDRD